jgi:hypothetical protein
MNFNIKNFGFGLVWGNLHNELARLSKLIKLESGKSELKRNYIRTFFSMVEAISYSTRQILLNKHDQNQIELSNEEIYLLKEKSIEIDSSGNIKTKDRYFNFESFFKFTYITYAKHLKKESLYKDLISDNRYNCFKDALEIRNRITHPKGPESILVSKMEYDNICKAHDWYHNFIIEILEGDALENETQKDTSE